MSRALLRLKANRESLRRNATRERCADKINTIQSVSQASLATMQAMTRRRDTQGKSRKQNRKGDARGKRELPKKRNGRARSGTNSVSQSHGSENRVPALSISRSPQVRRLLEGIGTPPPAPFKPDEFQLEALARLEHEDVVVTAPTGAGKTWIAREEIRRLLEGGRRAWYTSPLKALTNSKYAEFAAEFGGERVGILTGDRKENSDAPLIVGTTEIYRNSLFDALRGGSEMHADLVILDEAHYLADNERGHVWEEAIILTPPRVRLLLLSATIGNADDFARWIAEVRGVECGVVRRNEGGEGGQSPRPVPLRAAFLFPEGELAPLLDAAVNFNTEILRTLQGREARNTHSARRFFDGGRAQKLGMEEMPPARMLAALQAYDLLPAIVFLPTRRGCDEAATLSAQDSTGARREISRERREARTHMLREFADEHPEIRKHRHWDIVTRSGVASHHAGHLPAWKLAIEKLMSAGLLDAIFATTTVAAGVDFPARTVVLTNADARSSGGWRPLTASEFQQMTGRAGRRGKDLVGFIVAAPGVHQNPQKLATLLRAQPEPLESAFRATYTTLLNLLDAYKSFALVRETIERSFAHRDTVDRVVRLEAEREACERRIGARLNAAGCATVPVSAARGLERLASARHALIEGSPQTRAELEFVWLDEHVKPGRIVQIGRGGRRLVFVTERRAGNFAGTREDGRRASFGIERIGRVYADQFSLAEAKRAAAFERVRAGQVIALEEPRLRDARAPRTEAIALIDDLIDRLVQEQEASCNGNSSRADEALWSVIEDAEGWERADRRIEVLRDEVWQPFAERARVLAQFGYLDRATERVTERGRWLADLRVDRPLLVGEGLARGLFTKLDAPRITALVAALVADAERDYGELPLDDKLVTALAAFERVAHEVASVEWRENLDPAPEMNYSAAAAAARWAAGAKWDTLVRETRAEEGDLFRMLARTGESLLQLWSLRASHPEAASTAREAAEAVLREPVRFNEI